MKKFLKYFLFFLLIFFAAALLAEAVLGIFFLVKDRNVEQMAVRDFPYLYFLFEETETLNEHGFKTEKSLKKQPGEFRIVLTGGSVARGKKPDESIAHFLEEELNRKLQTDKIKVINAGVSAFVAEQEFLLTQLVLPQYKPDLIVSLGGYNDLLSFRINRYQSSDFPLPPHHWREMKVIENSEIKESFFGRFKLFFKNINRAITSSKRRNFEKNFDWSAVSNQDLQAAADAYLQIISDSYFICGGRRITYFHFLQPVRMNRGCRNDQNLNSEEITLCSVYQLFELGIEDKNFAFSLAGLLDEQHEVFTDACHVTTEGNKIISHAIAERIAENIAAGIEN